MKIIKDIKNCLNSLKLIRHEFSTCVLQLIANFQKFAITKTENYFFYSHKLDTNLKRAY